MKLFKKVFPILYTVLILALPISIFGYDCETIDDEIARYQSQVSMFCSIDQSSSQCIQARQNLNRASQWKAENCDEEGCEVNGYTWKDTGYRSGGHVIGRFYTGEETFCVQPEQLFKECATYTAGSASYGATDTIVKAIYGYNRTAKTNEHYAAAQAMIWGTEIPAGCESAYQDIINNLPENVSTTYSTNWETKSYSMNLNESNNDIDLNNTINDMSNIFTVSFPDGVEGTRQDNKANFKLTSIYPLVKTVNVNINGSNPNVANSDGGSVSARLLSSPTSQNFVMFDGKIGALSYTYYKPESFNIVTKTGNLKIQKIDEYGDNAKAGHAYKIWYAKEDENGIYSKDGKNYSKYLPFQSESDWQNGIEQSTFTTNEDGKIENIALPSGGTFDDGTVIGTYIIEEVDTTNPFILNSQAYVVDINENTKTDLTTVNDLRSVSLEIIKSDIEEPGEMEDEELYLNGAAFEVYDVSSFDGKTLDTNDGKNPLVNLFFLKKGQSVDLNDLLIVDSIIANEDVSNLSYQILNEHCDTAILEGSILTANKNDVLKIGVYKDEALLTSVTVYIINDDHELSSKPSFVIQGIGQFKGESGQKYVQLVDPSIHDGHYLPLSNTDLTLYYDEALTQSYKVYTSDAFGMIDFSNPKDPETIGTDDGDDIFYYQIVKGYDEDGNKVDGYLDTQSITLEELENGFKDEKGHLTVPYLKHSRTYLLCEANTPNNYDIVDGQNACTLFDTSDYQDGEITFEVEKENRKGRGDLEFQKLNEWLEADGEGITFRIYHAALQDTGLSYEENYMNVLYDEYDRPVKGEIVINPETGEDYFTVDANGRINLYDYLYFGYYVMEEVDTTNPFVENDDLALILIEHSKTSSPEFVNENRTVSFDVYKYDIEEEFRKLNDAEFTVYDISDTLDNDIIATQIGLIEEKSQSGELDPGFTRSPYTIEDLHFVKLNNDIDLYAYLIGSDDELRDYVGDKPVRYNLQYDLMGTVDVDGIFRPTKTGILEVEIVGGSYNLYGTAGPKVIYEDTYFDPYADLYFYEDKDKTIAVNIETIEYSGNLDPSMPGEYVLHYTLVSKDHVRYEFDRTITVLEDHRHVCKYDGDTELWYYADTKELCEAIDPGFTVEYEEPKLIPLVLTNFEDDGSWDGKFITKELLYVINDDDSITAESPTSVIDALAVFKGLTGHSYIQLVDYANHNLPLGNAELITYYDPELKYPYKRYIADEYGMIDISDENNGELLAPYPSINKDENGYYIPQAIANTNYSCSVDGYSLDEENNLCVNNYDNSISYPSSKETTWEVIKNYLEDYEPLDESFGVDHEMTYIYYLEKEIEKYDGSKEKVIKSMPLQVEDGSLEVPYLKHSRTYLVCETKLPEGYDYPEGQNACQLLDTSTYEIGVENASLEKANLLRRLDIQIYKTNTNHSIKLDGAEFDIYEVFEEGVDKNVQEGKLDELGVKVSAEGTMYYGNESFAANEFGACELDGKIDDSYIALDEYGESLSAQNPEGKCYKLYEPDIKQRQYLGHFVSGGIYDTYSDDKGNPISNAVVEIASDEGFKNIITTYKLDNNGAYKALGLSEGIYYARLKRPLKDDFESSIIDTETGNININIPTEEDYVPLEELPESYSELRKHYIAKGMIYLPEIKYGHTLLVRETKAPSGYYFDNADVYITPQAPYGINIMENYRNNIAIIIPPTGLYLLNYDQSQN